MSFKEYQEWSLQFFKKYWKYNVLLIFIFLLMFLINIYYSDKEEEEYAKKYPYYKTTNFFSGVVLRIERYSVRRGDGIEFKLNDEKGYTLGWANNDMYDPNNISEFLQIRDSISKESETDSVFVYRGDDVYYFVVSKRIDKLGNFY